MADAIGMAAFGGVPVTIMHGPKAGEKGWNFGIAGRPGIAGPTVSDTAQELYAAAPHLAGRWDGSAVICPFDAVRKVGDSAAPCLKAQQQPRGTCGGRAAKKGLEVLQAVLIAAGKRANFKRVSHAFPYAMARARANMLGPEDGVPDGSIPPVMANDGNLTMEEAGEQSDYGKGSDDLAASWGARGVPTEKRQLAQDNRIGKDFARVRTIQEYMDAAAVGGIGIVSDDNGFTMQRDKDGCCASVREPWYHYHLFLGGFVLNGEIIIPYGQSWGDNVPGGPLLMDGRWPNWCFGVRQKTAEEILKNNTVHMVFGFDLWDQQAAVFDWGSILDW